MAECDNRRDVRHIVTARWSVSLTVFSKETGCNPSIGSLLRGMRVAERSTMRKIARQNLCFAALLPAAFITTACGGGGDTDDDAPRDEDGDPILQQAFDDYVDSANAEGHCEARDEDDDDEDDDVGEVEEGQLLVLDAAPQCDLDQFGEAVAEDGEGRLIVDGDAVRDAPSLALCSCSELESSNVIMAPGQSDILGDVGANERIFASAPIRVDGRVISGGAARFDNVLEANRLDVEDVLEASNEVTVSEDAALGGLDIPGSRVEVGGTLTVPDGTDLSSVESTGDVVYDDIDVAPPCDCGEDVDYEALREDFRDVDDDGEDDFDDDRWTPDDDDDYVYPAPPHLLSDMVEERTVYLGCGQYYFDEIESAAALTIIAVGDVDVFVDGDINVAGPLRIAPQDDSSLELYVAGTFTPDNEVDLGNPDEPDAFRMYVRDQVRLAGPTVLSGSLFAPNAPVTFDNTFESQGAVLAWALDFAGPIQVSDGPRFTPDACLLWDEADANTTD